VLVLVVALGDEDGFVIFASEVSREVALTGEFALDAADEYRGIDGMNAAEAEGSVGCAAGANVSAFASGEEAEGCATPGAGSVAPECFAADERCAARM
jgi:hypothetical protein